VCSFLNLDVTEEVVSREEASNEFDLDRLPDSSGEQIRIVRVGDYDACPCIGDHVKNIREVGEFVFGSSSFENGVLRIRFKLRRPEYLDLSFNQESEYFRFVAGGNLD